jgi:uridine kinase
MPRLALSALAARVTSCPPRAAVTRVVAVDGPSGSGKTTLAGRLATLLEAPVIRMDDLYPGWDGLEAAVPRLLEWVLRPLATGSAARYRRYDWQAGGYAEWHDVPAAPVLVVEGVACGSRRAAPFLSLLVWVEAPRQVRLRRGLERDGEAYRPHWLRWAAQEEAHFAAEGTRERADVRVDGDPGQAHDPLTEVVTLRDAPGDGTGRHRQ